MKFVELKASDFSKFERKNKYGNFFQTAQRAELRKRMNYGARLMGVVDKEKTVGVFLVIEHNHEAWVQMGPVMDWSDKKLVKFFAT